MPTEVATAADRAFARYRRTGDPHALAVVYDATASALLRLALHLVRHPAHAEDVLQATFVTAIERAAAFDPAQPVAPWLCGILHRKAQELQRREGRAVDAGRMSAQRTDDPLDLAAAAEFTARVDAAIEQLPEPYRPVLRLGLRHHLTPAEIAHALDRPAGTVRSQLARGLELLRAALPAGVALGVMATTATRGLAAVRDAVLTRAGAEAATAAAASTIALWIGALMTAKNSLIAAAALALVVLAGVLLRAPAVAAIPPHPVAVEVLAAATTPEGHPAAAGNGATTYGHDEATRAALANVEDGWCALVTVRRADGTPIADAEVRLETRITWVSTGDLKIARTDASGKALFALDALRELAPIDRERVRLFATAWAPGCWPGHADGMEPPTATAPQATLDVELRPGRTLAGRVTTANGAPVADASVELDTADLEALPTDQTATDARGCFRLPLGDSDRVALQATAPQGVANWRGTLPSERDVEAPDLVVQTRAELHVRLLLDDGSPASGLPVEVVEQRPDGSDGRLWTPTADADGRIDARWLTPGPWTLRVRPISPPGSVDVARLETDSRLQTVVLSGIHMVRLRYCDTEDRPLRPLDVRVLRLLPEAGPEDATNTPIALHQFAAYGAVVNPLLRAGNTLRFRVTHGTASAEARVDALGPGRIHDVDLRLYDPPRTARLRVRLRHDDGGAPSPFRVLVQPQFFGELVAGDDIGVCDGAAEVPCSPGHALVRIQPTYHGDDFGSFAPIQREVLLRADEVTTIDEVVPSGGRVRFLVHAPGTGTGNVADFAVTVDGTTPSLANDFVEVEERGWTVRSLVRVGRPALWRPLLSPGPHELQIRARGCRDQTVGAIVRAREVTDVEVWLQAQ